MSPDEQILRLGGVARRSQLGATRRELRRAVEAGTIVRSAPGRYALPLTAAAPAAANGVGGVLCLLSAALNHGWAVRLPPDRPQVSIPRSRKLLPRTTAVEMHRLRLHPGDVEGIATTPDRTLVDCLRHLPFADALAVADSALREGFSPARLRALARDAQGPHSVRVRRIARLADVRAANPFESSLRAIALSVAGLTVAPQLEIYDGLTFLGRPDLVDRELRIVLEAESFEWHGGSKQLTRDARRYNALVVAGWLVLRFSWVDVIRRPDEVRAVLEAAVRERTNRCWCGQTQHQPAA